MTVQTVKEGSLTVESKGGDVHIGSMAGAFAEIMTAGSQSPHPASIAPCLEHGSDARRLRAAALVARLCITA